jgi:purine nucleosidase
MPKPRPFLIDTDPGVDDALAILMCFATDDVQVQALTVLGGNVSLAHTCRNARLLADRAPYSVEVFSGTAQPMLGLAPDAAFVHGKDGFGEAVFDAPQTALQPQHAAIAIIEKARQFAGELEILALGPLSNIALALMLEPKLPDLVKSLTIMGGALSGKGNITAFAEFNVAVDPEAAQIVLQRFRNTRWVDWEQTMQSAPSIANNEAWLSYASANARLIQKISRQTLVFKRSIAGQLGDEAPWAWADPLAAYAALFPTRCQWQKGDIEIVLNGRARGATVFSDQSKVLQVLSAISTDDFHAQVRSCLES